MGIALSPCCPMRNSPRLNAATLLFSAIVVNSLYSLRRYGPWEPRDRMSELYRPNIKHRSGLIILRLRILSQHSLQRYHGNKMPLNGEEFLEFFYLMPAPIRFNLQANFYVQCVLISFSYAIKSGGIDKGYWWQHG